MPQYEKTPQDELELRYQKIEDLIAQGFQKAHIVAWAREESDWNVSDRQVRNYVDIVHKRISKGASKIDRAFEANKTLMQLNHIIEATIRNGSLKLTLQAMAIKIKLIRLDDPQYEPNWEEVAQRMGKSTENIKALGEKIINLMESDTDVNWLN